jgi:hypothetical protein
VLLCKGVAMMEQQQQPPHTTCSSRTATGLVAGSITNKPVADISKALQQRHYIFRQPDTVVSSPEELERHVAAFEGQQWNRTTFGG